MAEPPRISPAHGSRSLRSEELIREVDEELQREKLLALWHRYGAYVMSALLLVLAAVAGWYGWQYWQARQRDQQALAFAAAMAVADRGAPAEAAADLAALAERSSQGFAALSRLTAAQALLEAGQRDQAQAEFATLAEGGGGDLLLRDLARLRLALIEIDSAPPEQLQARLEPLAAPGQPWRYEAQELLAMALFRAGELARARDLLAELAEDAGAPTNLRQRAAGLRDAIAAQVAGS